MNSRRDIRRQGPLQHASHPSSARLSQPAFHPSSRLQASPSAIKHPDYPLPTSPILDQGMGAREAGGANHGGGGR